MTHLEARDKREQLKKKILDMLQATEISDLIFVHTPNGLGEPNLCVSQKGEDSRLFAVFYVEEGEVCQLNEETLDPEFNCTIEEFEDAFDGFAELNVCQDCEGEGYTEYGPTCSLPASMCCGGCYEKIECECKHKLFS